MSYEVPEFKKDGFNCPNPECGVYAHMSWKTLYSMESMDTLPSPVHLAVCARCNKSSYWYLLSEKTIPYPEETIEKALERGMSRHATRPPPPVLYNAIMLYPISSTAPLPHPNIPNTCKEDYLEARNIIDYSPRGAAALLRLVLQKLCVHFELPGKDLNKDIGKLVERGMLSTEIQEALDSIRVIGNHAVHPKEINLNDTPDIAIALFEIINYIVDELITRPAKRKAIYNIVPKNAKEAIAKRDGNSFPDPQ